MTQHYKMHSTAMVAFLLLLMTFSVISMKAQDIEETSTDVTPEQSFSFVYIAQGNGEEMPIQEMERKLETSWSAIQRGPVIFYLSRGMDTPMILKANMDEYADLEKEREKFDEMIASLREGIQYSVDGAHDKQRILELLQEHDFVNEKGIPRYVSTNFEFHVGQDFWDFGNNETVIASLFFELNISQYIKYGYDFHFNVFCPRRLTWNETEGPFGILNPDECRRYINLDRSY